MSNFYIVDVDLENFATASRRYTGDIHNSTVVGLFMTHGSDSIASWSSAHVYYTSAHLPSNFITSICSGLVVLHCCVAVSKISTDMAHRAVPRR